jgi:hypothetical protein
MISLSYSEFLVECDDDYKHHVFVRSNQGYNEITNGDYNKDALINDLVYDISELVKERDKKQYSILDKIRAEIEGYKSTIDNAVSEDELKIEGMKEAYADLVDIIDKYKAEIKSQESEG